MKTKGITFHSRTPAATVSGRVLLCADIQSRIATVRSPTMQKTRKGGSKTAPSQHSYLRCDNQVGGERGGVSTEQSLCNFVSNGESNGTRVGGSQEVGQEAGRSPGTDGLKSLQGEQ